MIAGIDLGGTKTVVATGTPDGRVTEEWRFPTTTPAQTFGTACDWLRERGVPSAIGVAAFGPLGGIPGRDNYGRLLATPKAGWQDASIPDALHAAFPETRVTVETDVNAAALAEARLGAAIGLDDIAYITIGTGIDIGAGILTGGRLIHGALHPEFGHLKVPRMAGDDFAGICPFHADCLEGMASGPAIAARWGEPTADLPADHPAWDAEAWYLAHGSFALLAIVAPARIIIGGGVSQTAGFHAKTEALLSRISAGYYPPLRQTPYLVAPALGQQAGIIGALLLTSLSS